MSNPTSTEAPKRCPICQQKHSDEIEESAFNVSYCPVCGAPNFFADGARPPSSVKCCQCRIPFEPELGGGSVSEFYTRFETFRVANPRGVIRVWLRKGAGK